MCGASKNATTDDASTTCNPRRRSRSKTRGRRSSRQMRPRPSRFGDLPCDSELTQRASLRQVRLLRNTDTLLVQRALRAPGAQLAMPGKAGHRIACSEARGPQRSSIGMNRLSRLDRRDWLRGALRLRLHPPDMRQTGRPHRQRKQSCLARWARIRCQQARTQASPSSARTTPGFTCRARLNDWPRSGHTSAPCLVQAVVRQLGDLGDPSLVLISDWTRGKREHGRQSLRRG